MIQWIKDRWREWWSYEECGKWFGVSKEDIERAVHSELSVPLRQQYCTRRHNHRGQHKEKRK